MILADIVNAANGDAFYRFFEAGRFVEVRYIDGPRNEVFLTEAEARALASLRLLADAAAPT